ncbi:hypothetical protein B0H17DRAFT_1182806 [Mycena rosella]|uniref:Uncharacterized protein n=1 Tax=Mycena rosella TaxID=1033263 RepID=A0AAD7D2K3_MYCRO|nr:hypothetical protein B0H17DRAFT_1182806 [Mycena rosella]
MGGGQSSISASGVNPTCQSTACPFPTSSSQDIRSASSVFALSTVANSVFPSGPGSPSRATPTVSKPNSVTTNGFRPVNSTSLSGGTIPTSPASPTTSSSAPLRTATHPGLTSNTLPSSSLPSTTLATAPSTGFKHGPVLAGTLVPILVLALAAVGFIYHRRRIRLREREQARARFFGDEESKDGPADPSSGDAVDMAPSNPDIHIVSPAKKSSEACQNLFAASDKNDGGLTDGSSGSNIFERSRASTPEDYAPPTPPPRYSRPLPKIPTGAS